METVEFEVDQVAAEVSGSPVTFFDRLDEESTDFRTEEINRLKDEIARLEARLRVANELAEEASEALEAFKGRVVEVGGVAAARHDWCSAYDDIMEQLGLPRRKRQYTFVVRTTFDQEVLVMAGSEDEGRELIESLEYRYRWAPGFALVHDEAEVEVMGLPYSVACVIR